MDHAQGLVPARKVLDFVDRARRMPEALDGATARAPARLDDPLARLALADTRLLDCAARARRLADKPIPVMLRGETGTGKEVFAKALHAVSERRAKPFVALNCAAIPEGLIESELFGYREGAFTGARSRGARGKLEQAHGGTLFLDEIGDMPVLMQSRLLRVLAEGEVLPLGATEPIRVDLRIVCATHQDLGELIRAGRFREDLYYRLNGAVFELPALREREDRGLLIHQVLAEEAAALGLRAVRLDPAAFDALRRHDWPGNVRQLRHALRYACAMTEDGWLDLECFPADVAAAASTDAGSAPSKVAGAGLSEVAGGGLSAAGTPACGTGAVSPDALRERMLGSLRQHHWRVTAAARHLDMPRSTFYRKMEAFGIAGPSRLLEERA